MMSHSIQDAPGLGWLLARRAAEQPARTALTVVTDRCTTSLSHGELDLAARRLAARLGECFPADARILLAHSTGVHFAVALVGCLHAGLVAVPVKLPGDHAHHGELLAVIARDARASAVLTDTEKVAPLTAWRDRYGLTGMQILATAEYAGSGEPAPPRPADPNRLALLQYTSGSTGSPRGVMISHANLAHNVAAVWSDLGTDGPNRAGGWLPMYHDMGLALMVGPLLSGGTSVLMPPEDFIRRPHRWLRLIDEHDLAFSAAPDFAYALCVRRVADDQLAGLDLRRWRRALNGAEPVRAETVARFNARFAGTGLGPGVLTGGYGLAEATVYVSGFGPDQPRARTVDRAALARHVMAPTGSGAPGGPAQPESQTLVGCGRSRHLQVLIVDPETRTVVPHGHVGEIWIRGASVAVGYWERPTETADTFGAITGDGQGGFLRTGDLGALDDGELFITGRIKETLLVRGRTLYPNDIEARARANHPELRACIGAAFANPATANDGVTNDPVVLVHEVRGRLDTQRLCELVRGIRAEIADTFGVRLDTVVLTRPGTIPRTTSGKVRRAAARELYLAGKLPIVHTDIDALGNRGVPTEPSGRSR